jgi:hypothetical protein
MTSGVLKISIKHTATHPLHHVSMNLIVSEFLFVTVNQTDGHGQKQNDRQRSFVVDKRLQLKRKVIHIQKDVRCTGTVCLHE